MELEQEVATLLGYVAASVVMPRFRLLTADEITQKSAGEIVTIVDREAELRLHEGLAALGLGARIIGEEAAELDPALLDDVGEGLVWLIDPLDGTANFAAGREPFGMMVALVEDGWPIAGWILDPVGGKLFYAARGAGASCNGARVRTRATGQVPPVAALGTHFLPAERRARVHAAAAPHMAGHPVPRCAAASYPRVVTGHDDIALFQRILPWDHAAGVLFVAEAGGVVTHWDRSAYRIGGPGAGILAAATPELWQTAADALLVRGGGLVETEGSI